MQHVRHSQRSAAGYALTLFILGAITGLLALLGRLVQEFQHALLSRFPLTGMGPLTRKRSSLVPLLHDLDAADVRLILVCFALSTLMLLAGALLWHGTGHPATVRERIWTRFTTAIALLIWLAMLSASLIALAVLRIAFIVVSGGLALVGLFAFEYLLFEFQFTRSAPPLPGDDPSA